MNPLFLSHIIGDFLLQPAWLADLKQTKTRGLVLHAAIHAAAMMMLIQPASFTIWFIILAIAAVHGVIDHLKILYCKNYPRFNFPFLIDQIMHLAVLLAVCKILPYPDFWRAENGIIILILLFTASFAFGWWNLSHLKNRPLQNETERLKRFLAVAAAFALYIIPSVLL